jgi:hypothetical protein
MALGLPCRQPVGVVVPKEFVQQIQGFEGDILLILRCDEPGPRLAGIAAKRDGRRMSEVGY